jgi:hypothetical protein
MDGWTVLYFSALFKWSSMKKWKASFKQHYHGNCCNATPQSLHLGGVIVSVLVTGRIVRGFKPGRVDEFLRAIKIHSTSSFGGEAKPEAPCRKILRHVKDHLQVLRGICKIKFSFPWLLPPACYRKTLLVGLRESSGRWVRSFPLSTWLCHGFPCSLSPGGWTIGLLVGAVRRFNLIDIMFIIILQIPKFLIGKWSETIIVL